MPKRDLTFGDSDRPGDARDCATRPANDLGALTDVHRMKSTKALQQGQRKDMGLREVLTRATYSTEESSLLNEFYIPALSQSVRYDRAVGYFSAGMLSFAAQGLSSFVKREGKMRLLVGEPLDPEEYEAVKKGHELQKIHQRIAANTKMVMDNAEGALLKDRLKLLSWLVAAGRLQIKIGLTVRGLYHEKIGILEDDQGNSIVFQGSANETVAALSPDFNFESVAVYPSWKPEIYAEYGRPYASRFERLWNGTARGVTTLELPSAAYESIKSYYTKNVPPESREREHSIIESEKHVGDEFPKIPEFIGGRDYDLMSHQRTALDEWKAHDYLGILALATGAGKTITALHAAAKLADYHKSAGGKFILIVGVPYQVLADQWCDVMALYNINPIRCYRNQELWRTELDEAISDLTLSRDARFLAAVVVNATLARDEFMSQLRRVNGNNLLFIGDECHHHAADSLLEKLPEARYRLGLSATPWSFNEAERKARLKRYYGGVIATYSLERALRDQVLTPYEYHFHRVTLNDQEMDEYERLSAEIAPIIAAKEKGARVNEEKLMHLFMARARVLGSARAKFERLKELVVEMGVMRHSLFYCGDGSTDNDSGNGSLRDVERVAEVLGENGWRSSRFTAQESHAERIRVMENFRYGDIDAVVAIRVLDEGFDMPECRHAFLLGSSRNDRQFIQRRGRILRRAEGKDSAVIHDFAVMPGPNQGSGTSSGLVEQELERVVEFSRFSKNHDVLWPEIEMVAEDFNVDLAGIYEIVKSKEVVVE
ncbi:MULTISPECIES: DEAD/DEAH box helicase family protein [unclassified Thioalkalivibrio]|uniref:DEAD/DEAH box helicase family protein n=1 Tax=unclassified Thioalkalivibrio TaxID=2621013 RepID=UPI00039E5BBF|nr:MULTISPECIES: DEAD/DEAH box helicase family protein [unclassified Thioalkalivibrio]